MILADTPQDRAAALQRLMPLQKQDFKEIFRVMQGYPVTIRLLDPPLHEFLPSEEEIRRQIEMLQDCQSALDKVGGLPEMLRVIDPKLAPALVEDEAILGNLARLQKRN